MIDLWMILVGISAFAFAILINGDRFALKRYFNNSITYQMLANFGNIILLVLLPLLFSINWNAEYVIAAIIYGFVINFVFILLNLALQHEEVSIVGPLNGISPFFVLVFAFLFLGETVSLLQILGIFVMILATILLTYSSNTKFKISKGVMYVLIFVIIFAFSQVLLKLFIASSDPYTITYFTVCGGILSGIILMFKGDLRKQFLNKDLKQPLPVVLYFSLGKTLIYIVMIITLYVAISLQKVSLVGAVVTTLQPLFALIVTFAITQINPNILKETFDSKTTILKLLGVLLVCVGVYLISVF